MRRVINYALTCAMGAALITLYAVIGAGVLVALSGCATAPPPPPEPDPPCYAPWDIEPYKSGRAIPGPGVDGIVIPMCEYTK